MENPYRYKTGCKVRRLGISDHQVPHFPHALGTQAAVLSHEISDIFLTVGIGVSSTDARLAIKMKHVFF
jgi:hypothetical protein